MQKLSVFVNLEIMMSVLQDWLVSNYLVLKSIHIISVIALMAGLLYLPRLFVYHTQAKPGGELDETLKIMERKLLKIIINPALIGTYVFGTLLLLAPGMVDLRAGWLHAKLFLVFCLTGIHILMVRFQKDFAQNKNTKSQKFFRIFNEIPTILMILIIFLVVLQSF